MPSCLLFLVQELKEVRDGIMSPSLTKPEQQHRTYKKKSKKGAWIMRSIRLHCKKLAIMTIAILVIASPVVTVFAHQPGSKPAPEFSLDSIVITDGGETLELTPNLLAIYHDEMSMKVARKKLESEGLPESEVEKKLSKMFGGPPSPCPCGMGTYRAMLYATSVLWGDKIPKRSEIMIECSWLGGAATDFGRYITGTEKNVPNVTKKGIFNLIHKDNTVTDTNPKNIKELSRNTDTSYLHYKITNLASGESLELQYRASVAPNQFFELRKQVKFTDNPDKEIVKAFTTKREGLRDNLLMSPDWELFEGASEPPAPLPIVPIVVLFGTILLIAIMWIVGKRRKF